MTGRPDITVARAVDDLLAVARKMRAAGVADPNVVQVDREAYEWLHAIPGDIDAALAEHDLTLRVAER